MPITSREILATLSAPPGNGIAQGAAMFTANRVRQGSSVMATPAQREFLDAMTKSQRTPNEVYNHPATRAINSRPKGALTAAELAWLDRLPRDPSAVTFDQAQRLATMARSFEGSTDHADSRTLVEAIWQPVAAIHDRNAAEVELRNAQTALPAIPRSAGTALAEAISVEHPELLPHEVIARAATALDNLTATRSSEQDARISRARLHLADLDATTAEREAVLR